MTNTYSPAQRRARKLVSILIEKGCRVSLNDGEEWTVKQATTAKPVHDAMFTTDEDIIMARDAEGKALGMFFLIYEGAGQDPDEVIQDHTDNAFCNEVFDLVHA